MTEDKKSEGAGSTLSSGGCLLIIVLIAVAIFLILKYMYVGS